MAPPAPEEAGFPRRNGRSSKTALRGLGAAHPEACVVLP